MCSAEKFGAASSDGKPGAIVPPISHHPTPNFSQNKRPNRTGFYKWSRTLLTESASHSEIDVTYSKQSIRKFLTEARTRISVLRFCAKFHAAPDAQRKKESASRDASEQGKIPLKAQNEKEPS